MQRYAEELKGKLKADGLELHDGCSGGMVGRVFFSSTVLPIFSRITKGYKPDSDFKRAQKVPGKTQEAVRYPGADL